MTERYYRLKVEAWIVEEQEDGSTKTVSPSASLYVEGIGADIPYLFHDYWPVLKDALDASE